MFDHRTEIIRACNAAIDEKITQLEMAAQDILSSITTETKSSAGDKHETARTRMQFEQEKLNNQLSELREQKEQLHRYTPPQARENVFAGSIVTTNQGVFFIAIPLGRIKADTLNVQVISVASPLAKAMMGLAAHAEFHVNDRQYRILQIN
jgi:transcription elongation GreA/GreB family factor